MEPTLHLRSSMETALERFIFNRPSRSSRRSVNNARLSLPLETAPEEVGPGEIPADDPGAEPDSDDEAPAQPDWTLPTS
eukprot:485369-Pyramimonas_sp.AAC.1